MNGRAKLGRVLNWHGRTAPQSGRTRRGAANGESVPIPAVPDQGRVPGGPSLRLDRLSRPVYERCSNGRRAKLSVLSIGTSGKSHRLRLLHKILEHLVEVVGHLVWEMMLRLDYNPVPVPVGRNGVCCHLKGGAPTARNDKQWYSFTFDDTQLPLQCSL